ncbi:3'-5' exonuclease [Bradyrhizobium sp. RDI18]|uniref:3'-5' exonuclease n=1 Tax=Bradyrhizobium sp. RDI18 TaxID=3367400 RepID=UPI00371D9F73
MLALQYQTRGDLLAATNLQRAASALGPLEGGQLTMSTIHSAKGREWTAVYIMNAVEGCIPFRLAACREEERRLLFVAMTRAKRHLEMLVPKGLRRVGNGSVGLAARRSYRSACCRCLTRANFDSGQSRMLI